MTSYKPKLIEVALPLATINAEAAREKSIRHGHPSTLHMWWARRPLAAARAVIWASLVDDPSADPTLSPEEQEAERTRLFGILERLVKWENSNDPHILAEARAEIDRCFPDGPPPILDPFGGGGAIPLEAERLGLDARSGDLNPVAVLIQRAMIEIPPRFAGVAPVHPGVDQGLNSWTRAQGLAADIGMYGRWMRDEAFSRIGHHYPDALDSDGRSLTPIAWIWARTVVSPDPTWKGHVPLVASCPTGRVSPRSGSNRRSIVARSRSRTRSAAAVILTLVGLLTVAVVAVSRRERRFPSSTSGRRASPADTETHSWLSWQRARQVARTAPRARLMLISPKSR